jgi:hypothetical protein
VHEQVREEVVIAIPLPPSVERNDEEVRALEPGQHLGRARPREEYDLWARLE